MTQLNAILNRVFDLFMGPLARLGPWAAMIIISFAASVILLLVFKYTSHQARLKRRKNRATARLLEFILFKDDPVVNLGALPRSLAANAAYLGELLVPLLVSFVPVVILLIQMACWFEYRPLGVHAPVVLTVRLDPAVDVAKESLSLRSPPGLTVDAGPVRIPARNEVSWRVRPDQPGRYQAEITVGDYNAEKRIVVGSSLGACRNTGLCPRLSPNPGLDKAAEGVSVPEGYVPLPPTTASPESAQPFGAQAGLRSRGVPDEGQGPSGIAPSSAPCGDRETSLCRGQTRYSDRLLARVSPLRPGPGFWGQFLNPSERGFRAGEPVISIEVRHAAGYFELGGHSLHWLVVFFVLTLVFGFALMKPLRVTV